MEIKVALTNLGKYNEGELDYVWLELPATDEEVVEAKRHIGIDGVNYEEYFISDYEAPFEIGEHENIGRLNSIAEQVSDIDFPDSADADDVINFAHELCNRGILDRADEHVQDIVSDESLDEIVSHIAQDGGWQRVRFFIRGIEDMNADYYYINGYGNAENVSLELLTSIVDDLVDDMRNAI